MSKRALTKNSKISTAKRIDENPEVCKGCMRQVPSSDMEELAIGTYRCLDCVSVIVKFLQYLNAGQS